MMKLIAAALVSLVALEIAGGAMAQTPAPAAKRKAPATTAIEKAAVPAQIPTLDAATIVQTANAYLNATTTMIGEFVQIGGDGKRTDGKLYVQKPGRLRFEYAKPANLEIVADGTSVAIRDRKLATQDLYFIGQTPLKFLLKDRIDLGRDVRILDVMSDENSASILVEDKATFGGTSRIRLVFDPKTFSLKQWTVTDPQGFETLVSLFNLDVTSKPDPALFRIKVDPRP